MKTKSFLVFEKVEDQTAAGLESNILEKLEKNKIKLSKCRGQGYDGATAVLEIYKVV